MKALIINSVIGTGSTGRICFEQARELALDGWEVMTAYGRSHNLPAGFENSSFQIGSTTDVGWHVLMTRLFDNTGFSSSAATAKFLKWANNYDPDLLFLHNLHGYYINVDMLFDWIKKRPSMKVKWMLHDCWAFTGHCAYFSMAGCNDWKTHCGNCSQKENYPRSIMFDNSKRNFAKKRKAFTGVANMEIVTPSFWLKNLVEQSFLKEYQVEVRYHNVNTNIFKHTESNFREKFNLQNKIIVLGVASEWDKRKGLFDFYSLSELLPDMYQIVLVGLSTNQISMLPEKIIGLQRTDDAYELAQVYSAADLFINPSREETFGLTTVEAISCGTPAIVYKDTACEEVVSKFGGYAVDQSPCELFKKIMELRYQTVLKKTGR